MAQTPESLKPAEREAVEKIVAASGLRYGVIELKINVQDGKRKRTEYSVARVTLDDN